MPEETIPATEANDDGSDERSQYEFAFHLLPTVADGEVPGVFEELKNLISHHKGNITVEEEPQRFDLAYELTKTIDGRHQGFSNSFFGWVRFELSADELQKLTEEIKRHAAVLRFLLVRLTHAEIEHPFRVFEKRTEPGIVENNEGSEEPAKSPETLEKELNESLEELTSK